MEGASGYPDQYFTVAISDKQQSKGLFRIGDMLKGTAWTKKYEEREFADFYRAGSLKLLDRANEVFEAETPPWIMVPPSMQTDELCTAGRDDDE